MPSSTSLIDFIEKCGGPRKFLDLFAAIDSGKEDVKDIAPRYGAHPVKISQIMHGRGHWRWEWDDDAKLIIQHELDSEREKLNERAGDLTRKTNAPIFHLGTGGGAGPR